MVCTMQYVYMSLCTVFDLSLGWVTMKYVEKTHIYRVYEEQKLRGLLTSPSWPAIIFYHMSRPTRVV